MCYLRGENIKKAIICFDSKSAIEKLSYNKINGKNGINTLKIKISLIKYTNGNKKVLLTWIPGHAKIEGNKIFR